MNTHWKIFNIINVICLTLVTICCGSIFFNGLQQVNSRASNLFYAFIIVIILIAIINCLHNIHLTQLYANGGEIILRRGIFFWMLFVPFTGVISFFIYYTTLDIYIRFHFTGAYKRIGGIRFSKQFLAISFMGLYIVIAQVILFNRIKKSYRLRSYDSINEIGNLL